MRRSWWLAALVLAVAGLVFIAAARGNGQKQESGLTELAAAFKDRRPIEPRLTGGFGYAPCKRIKEPGRLIPKSRCSEPLRRTDPEWKSLARVNEQVRGSSTGTWDLEDLKARGILPLLLGDPSAAAVNQSITLLEEVISTRAGDAQALSDLAAAYLVRAQITEEPYDLMMALDKARQAVGADSRLPEARFNFALAAENLFLHAAARSAWQEYLRLDPNSPWSSEARDRLASLDMTPEHRDWDQKELRRAALVGDQVVLKKRAQQFPQRVREFVEQETLGRWGELWLEGNEGDAVAELRVANATSGALVRTNRDRLAQDAVTTILAAVGNSKRTRTLAEGHAKFRQGFAHYKAYETGRALEELALAHSLLASAGSPFAARAAFYRACAEHNLDRYPQSLAALLQLQQSLRGNSYPSLLAHIEWMQGLIGLVSGDPVGAADHYRKALVGFESVREKENASAVRSLLAESLSHLGRSREEWTYHYQALREGPSLRDPQLLYIVYVVAAQSLLRQGHPEVAIHFQEEGLHRLDSTNNAVLLSGVLFWRGLMQHQAGLSEAALISLQKARQTLAHEKDAEIRLQMEADADMAEGIVEVERNPGRAVDLLSTALEIYQKKEHHLLSLFVYQARAQAWRRIGRADRADADLRAGIAAYEKLGERIDSREVELAFLKQTGNIFDEMITFQGIEKRDAEAAFTFADRYHTRALAAAASTQSLGAEERRRLLSTEESPLPLADIQNRLPEGTALVQYSVLSDRLLIWLLLPGKNLQLFERPLQRTELRKKIEEVRAFPSRDVKDSQWLTSSRDLHEWLVAPWRNAGGEMDRVVFVPDKELHSVPFACLQNKNTGRYLVQDFTFTIAASATLFIRAVERADQGHEAAARTLAIGDPAFDLEEFRGLSRLPGANREAAEVARLYTDSRLLAGPDAGKEIFLDLAPSYDRIHFAGHALVNERNPLLSMLVFAPSSNGRSGALYAREIYQLDLSRTRLVVLSGCSTAAGEATLGEGFTNLARAFMAAGVPSVLGSLWPVDDKVASGLLQSFHLKVAGGADPAAALRAAQLELIQQPETSSQPSAWAAFEVFGASVY